MYVTLAMLTRRAERKRVLTLDLAMARHARYATNNQRNAAYRQIIKRARPLARKKSLLGRLWDVAKGIAFSVFGLAFTGGLIAGTRWGIWLKATVAIGSGYASTKLPQGSISRKVLGGFALGLAAPFLWGTAKSMLHIWRMRGQAQKAALSLSHGFRWRIPGGMGF